ncbi:hypothetical protein [Variovorax paradoxus]|uniref:hypothetical protein n=1 Tax=Variovorax paradoxus TaxID=34073 RepID=UPI001D17B03C|nr:hypothetical protein [Variovorax paradoxus]
MKRSRKDFNPKSRFGPVGIAVMVLFHVGVGYALVSGLARQTVELIKKPMEATIISEIKPPPPPLHRRLRRRRRSCGRKRPSRRHRRARPTCRHRP